MQSKITFVCIFFMILHSTLINQFGSCNVYPNYVINRFYPQQRERGGTPKGHHGHRGSGGHHRPQREEPPIPPRALPVQIAAPAPPEVLIRKPSISPRALPVQIAAPAPPEVPIRIPAERPVAPALPQAPGSTNVNSTNNASATNNQATNIIINLKSPGPTPEACPKSFLGTMAKIIQGTPCLEP